MDLASLDDSQATGQLVLENNQEVNISLLLKKKNLQGAESFRLKIFEPNSETTFEKLIPISSGETQFKTLIGSLCAHPYVKDWTLPHEKLVELSKLFSVLCPATSMVAKLKLSKEKTNSAQNEMEQQTFFAPAPGTKCGGTIHLYVKTLTGKTIDIYPEPNEYIDGIKMMI